MELAKAVIVLYENGVPVVPDHDFVKGLRSLVDTTWFVHPQSPVIHFNGLCERLREEYQFDVRCLGVLDETRITHFRTGYEFGSVKHGWVQEILDYLKPVGSKVHLHHYEESYYEHLSASGHDYCCVNTLKIRIEMEKDLETTLLGMGEGKLKYTDKGCKLLKESIKQTLEKHIGE